MGADIHLFVEYGNKQRNEDRVAKGEKPYFRSFGKEMNPGRNYAMFGILSKGVRWDYEKGFDAKPLPDDIGWAADDRLWIYVTNDTDGYEEDRCTMQQAVAWSQNGRRRTREFNGKITWVEHPDWHSHSWLTVSEFETAIALYKELAQGKDWDRPLEYEAILASMKVLEGDGENDVRVVFWFDN